jgi:hypothetical protein
MTVVKQVSIYTGNGADIAARGIELKQAGESVRTWLVASYRNGDPLLFALFVRRSLRSEVIDRSCSNYDKNDNIVLIDYIPLSMTR